MFRTSRPLLSLIITVSVVCSLRAGPDAPAKKQQEQQQNSYPAAARQATGDWFNNNGNNIWVQDPYRWLEQHDASDTKAWLNGQANLTRQYIDSLGKRKEIEDLSRDTIDYKRVGLPVYSNGQFYFRKNTGLQEQDSIWRSTKFPDGESELLIDPNKLWPEAERTLKNFAVSPDAKYLAYSASVYGSDVTEWKIFDLTSKKDLAETLKADFSSPQWSTRAAGFYYDKSGSIYFHYFNTDQSADQFIFSESGWSCHGTITTSGDYLLIVEVQSTSSNCRVLVRDLASDAKTVSWLFPNADAQYEYIFEQKGVLYFHTTLKTLKGSIISISLQDRAWYKEVVAQDADALADVTFAQGKFFANYLHLGHSVVKLFDLDGKFLAKMDLPGEGSAGGFRTGGSDSSALYWYSDYVTPAEVLSYDMSGAADTWKSSVSFAPKMKFDLSQFTQKVVTYKSKDGTEIPMTVTHHKDLELDGSHPVLLYGYGGFNINITPSYRSSYATWLRLGGVLAVPNLRGGSEGGEAWHESGIKLKRQNVFDDFRAAAHWLIDQKYTSKGKIVVHGASNGGLLVGAVLTQEPDLFGAALPHVGVLDMLRFPQFPVGSGWKSDYGDPANSSEFAALYAYSPVHNVIKGKNYPAVLVTTCDHDDRVEQSHSWKFTAALQYGQGGDRPIMLLVAQNAGHLYGWTTSKMISFDADRFAFVLANLR